MSQNHDDRNALVAFLQKNPDRSYRAGELKMQTGVSKTIVHGLLDGDSRINITEKPKGTFHYQAAVSTRKNSANSETSNVNL